MMRVRKGYDVDYYLDATATGRDSYYTDAVAAGEPPGLWHGRGAQALGLTGEVDATIMKALYTHGLDPRDEHAADRETWASRGPVRQRVAQLPVGGGDLRRPGRSSPHASREELAELAVAIRSRPAAWVAQDLVQLSTHPTLSGDKLEPRAVDLRAFVIQSRLGSGTEVRVLPAALSRVAPAGSLIVNSSRGGGAKDTWVLR